MNTLGCQNNNIIAAPASAEHLNNCPSEITKRDSSIDLEDGYDGGASDTSESEAYQGSPSHRLAVNIIAIFSRFNSVLELGSYETAVSFLEKVVDTEREGYNAIEDLRREIPEEKNQNLKRIQAAGIITAAVRLFASVKITRDMPDYPPKWQNSIETVFREKHGFWKGIPHGVPVPEMQQRIHMYVKAEWKALGTDWLTNGSLKKFARNAIDVDQLPRVADVFDVALELEMAPDELAELLGYSDLVRSNEVAF
ncbi:hypothetical protein AOL_s00091g23 [Orbilia oligospora ATCC 24927]|uniref:Uncharacterized protein n=1 Tax=Arthrobotrys oligospora (strain ATCC 24927 / CBS 115.81 / DSM 1491) TaxID=756982 RepID=G1XHX1_ARTOA|nr:hypothetical protein AOL_s00091g23 [Orbilia oligospora ATCC 24927]EGX47256.1 hypothetical protein AOL_s00091g23 [Orbilia oligospora ATCC 24927]